MTDWGLVTLLAVIALVAERRSGPWLIVAVVTTALLIEAPFVKPYGVELGTLYILCAMAWFARWQWWEERKQTKAKSLEGNAAKSAENRAPLIP